MEQILLHHMAPVVQIDELAEMDASEALYRKCSDLITNIEKRKFPLPSYLSLSSKISS